MLGYVRAHMPELRMRDHECYRALYCGLCHHMGKCTGQCSRFSLSYDFVFLAALRLSLTGEQVQFKKKRCIVHPFKKRLTVIENETLRYCADASALLTYHKCRDDVTDEKGFKRFRARLASLLFSRGYRKAKGRHPQLDQSVAESLARLRAYELDTAAPPSADAPAEIFGDLMADVFAEDLEGADARIAANLGRAVGHWIYLADAADDFLRDRKKGSFNPYLRLFGDSPEENDWNAVMLGMKKLLSDAECAFLLVERHSTEELHEILCNILYLGMPQAAEKILKQNRKGESEQHENSL